MKGVAHNQGDSWRFAVYERFQYVWNQGDELRRVQQVFSPEEFNIFLEILSVLGIFEKKRLTTMTSVFLLRGWELGFQEALLKIQVF